MSAPEPRTWITEIGYPPADTGPLQVLHSHMAEPDPLPEPELELEAGLWPAGILARTRYGPPEPNPPGILART